MQPTQIEPAAATTAKLNKFEFKGRRLLSVNEFCRCYGIGRTSTYELINSGQLKTAWLAGRRLVPIEAAETLVREAMTDQGVVS
jgi:Helix-turn-helix domain